MKTFINLVLDGERNLEDIDDFIDRWHNGEAGRSLDLDEYLGLSFEEYSLFVQNPINLKQIIEKRKKGK